MHGTNDIKSSKYEEIFCFVTFMGIIYDCITVLAYQIPIWIAYLLVSCTPTYSVLFKTQGFIAF